MLVSLCISLECGNWIYLCQYLVGEQKPEAQHGAPQRAAQLVGCSLRAWIKRLNK